jgi:hypothetical protein
MQSFRVQILVAVALAAFVAAPASAHLQTKTDPDDTEGVLDIREATFKNANGKFRMTMTTQGNWTISDLSDGSPEENRFAFNLDTNGDEGLDYVVRIDGAMGEMEAEIITGDFKPVATAFVFKDGKTVGVRFRKGKVDPRSSHVRWGAASVSTGKDMGCPSMCGDNAPDKVQGLYRHNL